MSSAGIPIKQYLSQKAVSQVQFSSLFNKSQSAVSKMLHSNRELFVVELDNGAIELRETRVIGRFEPESLSNVRNAEKIPKYGCVDIQH
mgnify:CR=1 FL=1